MKTYIGLIVLLLISGVLGYWYHITRIDTILASCCVSTWVTLMSALYLVMNKEK